MRMRLTSRPQVSGWRFMLRRVEHALVRRETVMVDDPQRGQSMALTLGIIAAVLVAAICAVMALVSPQGVIDGSTKVVADRASGALYVRVGERLDPVLNLTSARLISGSPANPKRVKANEIAKYPRGPLVGIVGAPQVVEPNGSADSEWTLCNTSRIGTAVPLDPDTGLPTTATPVSTTVIGGPLDMAGAAGLPTDGARVVSYDGDNWLLYTRADGAGVRAKVDTTDPVVTDALGIDGARGLPIGRGLFDALVEERALTVPSVPNPGAQPRYSLPSDAKVGSVLRTTGLDGEASFYVALDGGVQKIGQVAATMLRSSNSVGNTAPVEVAPDVVKKAPASAQLDVAGYPTNPVRIVPDTSPVTCLHWQRAEGETAATTTVLTGRSVPLTVEQQNAMVAPVTAPGSGGATADRIFMPPGPGRFVQVTADSGGSKETLWWLADTGVRYGIDTTPAGTAQTQPVAALGLDEPAPAPWSMVRLYAVGPPLSQRDALVSHDGIAPDEQAAALPTAPSGG
ncbi:type VII secretion protein EccB [Aldersonia sp. NBC_00410]|uniref:type VII secretion protein EccB n=1 Tax=Aldersonia sp. NBC_00410 TaxID=2975954 RepID=UPI00225C0E86|nr:type VII secretion protein EccB [Aldersonia sp. NBC_00410]MCX5046290.1 type VII secretion protein EccB [Aldersonia sp. NBC_00410]